MAVKGFSESLHNITNIEKIYNNNQSTNNTFNNEEYSELNLFDINRDVVLDDFDELAIASLEGEISRLKESVNDPERGDFSNISEKVALDSYEELLAGIKSGDIKNPEYKLLYLEKKLEYLADEYSNLYQELNGPDSHKKPSEYEYNNEYDPVNKQKLREEIDKIENIEDKLNFVENRIKEVENNINKIKED